MRVERFLAWVVVYSAKKVAVKNIHMGEILSRASSASSDKSQKNAKIDHVTAWHVPVRVRLLDSNRYIILKITSSTSSRKVTYRGINRFPTTS